jgi:hypothetical protein
MGKTKYQEPKFRFRAPLSQRREIHCHKMIRATAIEMAAEVFARVMAGDNELYAQCKALCPELDPTLLEIKYIELLWPKLIPEARATLARLLATNIDEKHKMSIHEALVLDAQLMRGRQRLVTAK